MDQNVSKYGIGISVEEWPLFAYTTDVALPNAWLLYRMCLSYNNRPLAPLDFCREIAQVYMHRLRSHTDFLMISRFISIRANYDNPSAKGNPVQRETQSQLRHIIDSQHRSSADI